MNNKKGLPAGRQAVVLLSGGLDSAVTLSLAKAAGYECFCLVFDYGQRHRKEIAQAKKIAKAAKCQYQVLKINFPWKGSALLDNSKVIRVSAQHGIGKIPNTYVPGRNIIFLSFALSFAEAIGASALYIGAHAQDYSGYPDCRPEFYRAFRKVILTGAKAGKNIEIKTPLINKTKAQIIKVGNALGVNFKLTWSCYKGGEAPCGKCDSCYFRNKGFNDLGLIDPLL